MLFGCNFCVCVHETQREKEREILECQVFPKNNLVFLRE